MQQTTRITVSSIFLLGVLSGCVTNQSTQIDPAIQSQAPQPIIANRPVGKGYYALIEKINGHWKVVSIDSTPISNRDNNDQEVLFINRSLRSIAPSFDSGMYTGDRTECVPLAQMRERKRYWLCNSYFSSIEIGMSMGRNIVSCALTLCLGAGIWEELDRGKIQQVVIESDLLNIVKKRIAAEDRSDYLAMFSNALMSNDSGQLEAFIGRYRNNDPDGLVSRAADQVRAIKETDAMYSKLTSEIDHAKEKPDK